MRFVAHLIGISWAMVAIILLGIIVLGVVSGNDRSD